MNHAESNSLRRQVASNALLHIHADAPLWTLVAEITGLDKQRALATCVALGWQPDQPAKLFAQKARA